MDSDFTAFVWSIIMDPGIPKTPFDNLT